MIEINKIYNEECLEGMKKIDTGSIDMILCDLPYGTTRNKWDVVIPLDKMWSEYGRIIKDTGCIALFSSQPFTTTLINSNKKLFRYDLVWDKVLSSGFLNANRMPLRRHETICIFYKKPPVYNPVMEERGKIRDKGRKNDFGFDGIGCYGAYKAVQKRNNLYYPVSILQFSNGNRNNGRIHPTQKPVALFKYLIETYTNENEIVLDNCMGSGTTAIACLDSNRNYIGFEQDINYFESANKRISEYMLAYSD